jgi:hypothetical protein
MMSSKNSKILRVGEPPGPPTLEAFITNNEMNLERTTTRRPHSQNLSPPPRSRHWQKSKKMCDIIIKPADKGSAVVVMNKSDYITEAHCQLSGRYYIPLNLDPTQAHAREVNDILDAMLQRGEIPPKCHEYLHNLKPRTPNFYLLPKIHKCVIPPPDGPIMSANECPTERISFIDSFLQPIVKTTRSFIKDTPDFLLKLQPRLGRVPPNSPFYHGRHLPLHQYPTYGW